MFQAYALIHLLFLVHPENIVDIILIIFRFIVALNDFHFNCLLIVKFADYTVSATLIDMIFGYSFR
jgi:hypothetical protein